MALQTHAFDAYSAVFADDDMMDGMDCKSDSVGLKALGTDERFIIGEETHWNVGTIITLDIGILAWGRGGGGDCVCASAFLGLLRRGLRRSRVAAVLS